MVCNEDQLRMWGKKKKKGEGQIEEYILKFDLEREMIFKKWDSKFSAFN